MEDNKSKGEKQWAEGREQPAEAQGRRCSWAKFSSRCGGGSSGGVRHIQVVARFSGPVSELLTETVCFHLSAPHRTSRWPFPPSDLLIPKQCVFLRGITDQCLIQEQLIEMVVKTFEHKKQSTQVKTTGSGRESTHSVTQNVLCRMLVSGG